MNRVNSNDKKRGMEFIDENVGELIESLQHMGNALAKIQKQLGIKEVPLPLIDKEENLKY